MAHREHHHQHHGPDCTCGCHDHSHDNRIRITTHDISVTAGVTLTIDADYEDGIARIKDILRNVAAEITELGGIVGHLKALVTDLSQASLISVTDEETVDCQNVTLRRVSVDCAFICMALEPEELREILVHHLSGYL